jgi:hypothetical protein
MEFDIVVLPCYYIVYCKEQKMKKTGYPFDKFLQWLQDHKELSPLTATGYASQCRRIIRSAGVTDVCNIKFLKAIEADQVDLFILEQRKPSQTPFRRSWGCFYEFMNSEGHKIADIALDRHWEDIPRNVAEAIRELDQQNFPFRLIPSMKWKINPKMTNVIGKNVIQVEDRNIVLPTEPLLVITQWAYGDKMPTPKDWLVPRSPHSAVPMPLTMLRRVAGII